MTGIRPLRSSRLAGGGFTLIELMITIAIVAILTSVALPAYTRYIERSRVPPALDALSSFHARMEQRLQDSTNGLYTCPANLPTANNFAVACAITNAGAGFTATATGSGSMAGYAFTIDQQGTRVTTAHPRGVPATNCWSTRGTVCDS
jgi:type IV pilus assembly protein PilE